MNASYGTISSTYLKLHGICPYGRSCAKREIVASIFMYSCLRPESWRQSNGVAANAPTSHN